MVKSVRELLGQANGGRKTHLNCMWAGVPDCTEGRRHRDSTHISLLPGCRCHVASSFTPPCQAFPTTVGGTLWDLSRRKLLHPEAAFCRALCHSSSSGCIPRRVCCALLQAAALASTSCGAEAALRASPAAKQAMHQRRESNLVFFLPCPLSCISF